MRENFVKIPLLQQREIEMKVIGPIVRAFAAEIGEERAFGIVRRAMQDISRQVGAEMSEKCGSGLKGISDNLIPMWSGGGELVTEPKTSTEDELSFDVKRCAYAELYRELGFSDIGALISCDRDAAFLEGFDDSLELVRAKTIMAGDDRCDFCYRKK